MDCPRWRQLPTAPTMRWRSDPLDCLLPLIARDPPSESSEALETDGTWAWMARAVANWEQAGGAIVAAHPSASTS